MARANMSRDLTQGSPSRLLIGFSLPLLAGMLFQQLYSFVDTAVVGRTLGYDALAAVGSTSSLNFLVIGFCTGLCNGFAIPIAQAKGAQNETELRRFVMHAVYLCAVISLVLAVATGLMSRRFLIWLNTQPELLNMATDYIRPIFFAIPATVLYNMAAGVMRSLGDSKTPMIAIVIASVVHVALDFLFILGFNMGVAGAGWATVISQLASGLWCLWVLMRRFPELKMQPDDMKLRAPFLRRLAWMGLPFGLQYSITGIGSIMVTIAVNGLGTVVVAAVTAAEKLRALFNIVIDALAAAIATYAGQNLGARKLGRIHQGMKSAAVIGCIYCVVCFAVLLVFGQPMLSLFVDADDPAVVADVLEKAQYFLMVNCAMYIPLLFVNILRFAIQGLGYTTVAMVAGLMELIGRTAVAVLLVPALGYTAAAWANPAAWLLADAFLFPCYFLVMKKMEKRLASIPA